MGYDSVSSYFDEQQEFDPMPTGIQGGFIILEDGKAMGLVLKTARHAVIVIEFGEPVSKPDRLVDMTAIPIDYEEAFFAGLD